MSAAAIRGCFSDFKIIRGRKCAQLVIEVPLEEADRALAALGGIPQAATERWVAVARLNPVSSNGRTLEGLPSGNAGSNPAAGPKEIRRFSELSPAQQAGIKCSDESFQRYCAWSDGEPDLAGEDQAAKYVRTYCRVDSRADLNTSPEAAEIWLRILRAYETWMLDPVEQ